MPYKFNPFTGTFDDSTPGPAGTVSAAGSGTAAAPGIAFSADPNTGIYSPGADQVAISTGGTGRLFVGSTGQIGISQSSLATGGFSAGTLRIGHATSQTAGILFQNTSTATDSSFWYTDGTNSFIGSNNGPLQFYANGFERLRIDSSGRVGIGTNSPAVKLEVVSSTAGDGAKISAPSPIFRINASNNSDANLVLCRNGTDKWLIGNYNGSTDQLGFYDYTAGAYRLVINTNGNVGIGIATPQHKLQVSGGSLCVDGFSDSANAYISFREGFSPSAAGGTGFRTIDHSGLNADGLGCYGADGISFYTFALERARIDSSGRLLVGTSNSIGANSFLQSVGVNNSQIATFHLAFAGAVGAEVQFSHSRNATPGSYAIVNNNDALGQLHFCGDDGTKYTTKAASIEAYVDGTPGANDMPGRLVFSTTADGAATPTERMRITQNGWIQNVANDHALTLSSATGAGTTFRFVFGKHTATLGSADSGTVSYQVFTNGNVQNTNNSYGAISDIKLKENIVDAGSQWSDLKALQVRKYNFKEETGQQIHTQIGLVAQEVELVSPGLVSESPDIDNEGNDLGTLTKSVNYSVLYMKAVKALQEAMERIEALEAKVAALESK